MGGIFRTVNTPHPPGGHPRDTPKQSSLHSWARDNSEILCTIGGLTESDLAELTGEGKV